jgi:plastocyanin
MAITKLQPFNLDTTANYTFANIATDNANLGNLAIANFFSGAGNNLSNITGGNVTGQVSNATVAGTVYTNAQPNITSTGSLTGLTVSNATGVVDFTTTANVTLGAVGNLHISGGTNAYVLSTDGAGTLSWVAQSGGGGGGASISNGNSNVNIPSANGNINFSAIGNANVVVITGTGANISGTANVTGNLTAGNIIAGNGSGGNITNANVISANTFIASGNITASNANLGNLATANYFAGSGNNLSNIQAANISGQVANALVSGTIYTNAQPNITSVGTLTDISVSGNGVFGGNLTVNGTLTYINSTTLSISDPIINLQTGPNGAAPVANSGKDVGTALNYYDTSAKIAWMGWDISNAEIAFGSNVSISSEVVTYDTLANIRSGNAQLGNTVTANFFTGSGNNLSNIQGGNVSGQVPNALISSTVYTNAQPNITSVGSLTGLTVSNVTGVVDFTTTANVTLGAVGNLHISGGTNAYVLSTDGAGTLSWVAQSGGGGGGASISNGNSNVNIPAANGNINLTAVGNTTMIVTGTGANISGTANITGNLSAGNIIAGNGSGGNITNANVISANTFIATGNISAGNANLGNLAIANFFSGAGNNLSNITASNITGQVANALISGTVYTNAQPNITSVGSLTSLDVTGNTTSGNANLGNLVTANFFTGNGSQLSALTFGNITTFSTAGLTTDELYLQATTRLNVTASGASGYLFDQYGATLNPAIYITSGQTLAFNLNVSGHPFLIQTSGGANYSTGLEYVDTAGTVLTTTSAQGQIAGTLYWKVPYGIVGNYKYQCSIHGGMNGNIVVTDANVANITVGTANSVAGGNVTGNVANANFSGFVTGNAQGNITSVGSLTGLTVSNVTGVVDFTTTANVTLGAVANLHISGGTNGYVLSTDGSSTLSWVAQSGGGGSPGGTDTQVQFNDSSAFGGNAGLTFNKTTTTLTANNFVVTSTANLGSNANVIITGGTNGYVLSTNGAGGLSWIASGGGGGGGASISNGTSIVDIATSGGNVTTSVGGTANVLVVTTTGANITGTLNVTGQSNLGAVGNVVITGGTNGYVLSTNGAGGLSWIASGGGGGGGASISNGTSNVNIATVDGNITMGVAGVANVVTVSSSGVSAAIKPRIDTIADGTTVTINADITDLAIQTNTQTAGTLTIAAPSGTPYQGQKLMFRLQSTNVQTFSWNAVFNGSTDLNLPSTSSGSSKYDYVGFIYNSTQSKWNVISKNFGF